MSEIKTSERIKIRIVVLAVMLSLSMYFPIPVRVLFAESTAFVHKNTSTSHCENPLLDGMQTLDRVYRDLVSAVAVCDGKAVYKALTSMHGTRERTYKGLKSGVVKIPKNPKKFNEFIKMDENFHADLESLSTAAGKNDEKQMLAITKRLLDSCANCHQSFRK